jgi:hypothetical protein
MNLQIDLCGIYVDVNLGSFVQGSNYQEYLSESSRLKYFYNMCSSRNNQKLCTDLYHSFILYTGSYIFRQ